MYSAKVKRMVAGQIIAMIESNVFSEYGMESFMGWLEDGNVFYNAEYRESCTDEEIEQAIELSKEIAPIVDEMSWKLNIE